MVYDPAKDADRSERLRFDRSRPWRERRARSRNPALLILLALVVAVVMWMLNTRTVDPNRETIELSRQDIPAAAGSADSFRAIDTLAQGRGATPEARDGVAGTGER